MGYRSTVLLKTTTEGYMTFKMYDSKIEKHDDKCLAWFRIERTKDGYYKFSVEGIKWYDGYNQVENFRRVLKILEDQEIPYSFIRLGEDVDDIEHNMNWTEDMPDEISEFEPEVSWFDPDGGYEDVDDEDYKEKPDATDAC
jgi:hypothetical protein